MAELDFVTLDVFTTTPYKGNPLAIVHLPAPGEGAALTHEQKLAITGEFNLSETVFLHSAAAATAEGLDASTTRRIDIFMPGKELPFAGHPTIGSAKYVEALGIKQLITKAGPISVVFGDGIASASIPHNTHRNSKSLVDIEARIDSSRLHASPEIRAAELSAPIFSIVRGMTFALIRLPSLEHLAQTHPGPFPIPPKDIMDEEWNDTFIGRYYNVLTETSVSDAEVRTVKLRTRMLETTMEDPATGSAACALTSFLALNEYEEKKLRFELTQGVEMGRQSDIVVDITVGVEGGARRIEEVLLGGTARQIMKGKIAVPP
ncbi:phenazine biosynthesis-like protein [Plectosphaerella plurivora]|uniref:Phenazine biosynthesis-like protein n=1 Tax=Plectosphaerella plurivora TaxID=936078 RepID=A0A9P8V9I2_9PEZI|nr:phenazine biosynthesis-like protein [Plectosphaerella plurivora]